MNYDLVIVGAGPAGLMAARTAARACKTALEGGDGNGQYNRFWQQAFYFHSRHYLGFSKETYPVARVLADDEVDTLYGWLRDNNLNGLPGDVLSDNLNRLREEMPAIAEKIAQQLWSTNGCFTYPG